MDLVSEIIASRDAGVVRCGILPFSAQSISTLAGEFHLEGTMTKYSEVDLIRARELLTYILHRDLAYNAPIMSIERAAELAERFLSQFENENARFFTNGVDYSPVSGIQSFSPVTDATFDTGILVIGRSRSGCLWVEDED